MHEQTSATWLAIAAGSARVHGGNDGYDDVPSETYVWDSTVPHHAEVSKGDRLVLWDKSMLIGASVIQSIQTHPTVKTLHKCPVCNSSSFKARKSLLPRNRCYTCGAEFEEPASDQVPVVRYESHHPAAWIDLYGMLKGSELRALALQPKSQQSFRRVDWNAFSAAVKGSNPEAPLGVVDVVANVIAGGHKSTTVRVRIGQASFRHVLLKKYGSKCAISGGAPREVLEAAHLYSYALEGEHHESGGLLLRRDLHTLFDRGAIAIDPETQLINVAAELLEFPAYALLQGQGLQVSLSDAQIVWIANHWKQHRT